MPTIVFEQPDGVRRQIEAPLGITLMEAARQSDIAGVVALCGGACACATCHVYVDTAWIGKLEPLEDMEEGMLETAWEPRSNSRLSCQIQITAKLDGLKVRVPAKQAVD
jgi:2Fe-2S ferredoxin